MVMEEAKLVMRRSSSEFMQIPLESEKPKKLPKRKVYFSDGYLDEYSTDEDDIDSKETQPLIDPKSMTWFPYLWYLTWWVGSKALSVCDYLGEHLAYFLGITAPKFQYEMEQYQKLMEEEEKLRKKMASDNAGWTTVGSAPIEMAPLPTQVTISSQPMSSAPKVSLLGCS